MIRRALLVVLGLAILSTGFAQGAVSRESAVSRTGENAGYGSRNATVLSMMGWGVGLVVGIATLCALIPNNEASTAHTASTSSTTSH